MANTSGPCMCGDTQCPSCGSAQGTLCNHLMVQMNGVCWSCGDKVKIDLYLPPLPKCHTCGEIPWDEVRMVEIIKTSRVSRVEPCCNMDKSKWEYYTFDEDEDDLSLEDMQFEHLASLRPGVEYKPCYGEVTLPEEFE